VDSYPTEEHYGLVFVFLGDLPESERPPILLPENNHYDHDYSGPQWRFVTGSWSIKANYERCVENGVDPAHNEFVHPRHGFGGANDDYYVPEHTLNNHDWGNSWGVDYFGPPNTHEILQRNETTRKESGYLTVYSGYHGPNQIFTYIHITENNFLHQYIWETPIDEYNTKAFLINFSNFMDEDIADDEEILDMNLVIADDDVRVLEPLDPIKTPNSMTQELMMPSDKCIVAYRKDLKQWADKGWRIDSKKAAEANDEKTYAIPSPQRREQKGWIIDQVPLIYAD
jgi:phenylpropionate dioxygenase-like ring-hydroxylating dioxygenase large terminal subunit